MEVLASGEEPGRAEVTVRYRVRNRVTEERDVQVEARVLTQQCGECEEDVEGVAGVEGVEGDERRAWLAQ